jgi:hypothetical protein
MRFLAPLIFLLAITSLDGFAYNVQCTQGPTSKITGNYAYQTVYSCTIPANTVSTNQSLRITAMIGVIGTGGLTELSLNGVVAFGSGTFQGAHYWQGIQITNTGSTTGEASGTVPGTTYTPDYTAMSGLSWASAQTLEIIFYGSTSDTATGTTFTVEVMN